MSQWTYTCSGCKRDVRAASVREIGALCGACSTELALYDICDQRSTAFLAQTHPSAGVEATDRDWSPAQVHRK